MGGGDGGSDHPGSANPPNQSNTGSDVSESAPESHAEVAPIEVTPGYLQDYMGQGKYNIGLTGAAGVGKSSVLNDIIGADLAMTSTTECTLEPTGYALPLHDPAGFFQKFLNRLPQIHKDCMRQKLEHVRVWDLPGCGTRLHPSETYASDKGLRYFDFVVIFVGDRVLETDSKFIESLTENNIKHMVCRSKLDLILSPVLVKKKKELGRLLQPDEKANLAAVEMDQIRNLMVQEISRTVPTFHGHMYLLFAPGCANDEDPNFEIFEGLNEAQLAMDRLLLDVVKDRHGHDLRRYFDRSLYGHACRVVFNWLSSIFPADPVMEPVIEDDWVIGSTIDTEVSPDDSVSQISAGTQMPQGADPLQGTNSSTSMPGPSGNAPATAMSAITALSQNSAITA